MPVSIEMTRCERARWYVTSEIVQLDFEDPGNVDLASQIVDLLFFYKTGIGSPRDILTKVRCVVETYCTFTYPGFFDSGDTLESIVEKIRTTGRQHPACALLDELDDIHNYSRVFCRDDDPAGAVSDQLDVKELTDFVRRTLKIVKAIPEQA